MKMTRLNNDEYARLSVNGHQGFLAEFALIDAVVKQVQYGAVYLMEGDNALAFVKNRFGFSQISQVDHSAFDAAQFLSFLESEHELKGYYLMYDPPAALLELAPQTQLAHLKIRSRQQFKYLQPNANLLKTIKGQCPPGYRIVNLTTLQEQQVADFQLDIGSRFWKSWQQFQQLGIGYGIVEPAKGRIVAICYSACVAGGVAEIDVATDSAYRGKALASVAVASFLEACVERQILANWDCFSNNTPSLKLAHKFNFVQKKSYKLLSFNMN